MRPEPPRYPVDRYLVESSNKFEMVNIIDDEIWNTEPALRPEDETMLRKLHEMLQSTADDLKLLSGELSKFHEPGVRVKSAPTPLDEEFNEKVHIEEVVNAKFHGYKIVENPLHMPEAKPRNDTIDGGNITQTKILNTDAKAKAASVSNRPIIHRNLGLSRTRIIQINGKIQDSVKNEKLNNAKIINLAPTIAYNEFSFQYTEPKIKNPPLKVLQFQDMPSINIRSELKEQKALQLNIVPDSQETRELNTAKSNVSVVSIIHENVTKQEPAPLHQSEQNIQTISNQTVRKISKMLPSESSESTNNASYETRLKQTTQKRISVIRSSPKSSMRNKSNPVKKEADKRSRLNIDEWKKKLNAVYGSSSSKKIKMPSKKHPATQCNGGAPKPRPSNNAEYIPYSQLTLGGARVSDIEKEIPDLPNNPDVQLSPIIDKILSSRENSFHKRSPSKQRLKDSPKILTTSDENLLQEVIDIERSVSEILSKKLRKTVNEPVILSQSISNESSNAIEENESYDDDFEDDKSDNSGKPENQMPGSNESEDEIRTHHKEKDTIPENDSRLSSGEPDPGVSNDVGNTTYTKAANLSFKNSVDIFEFIHSVDTQDMATQSNTTNKKSPKETQTSPRNERQSIQPIHNDLWPSIDPRREVEKMFEIEKDFIKKLIIDEYGDLLEKNLNKPSTSNETNQEERGKNIVALQKNTQTSPAHVKSVMTSPKITKTRTTSPFHLSIPVHQQTSPLIFVTNEYDPIRNTTQTSEIGVEADDISINLSSPRFNLKLPRNSREVLSKLEDHTRSQSKISSKREQLNNKTYTKTTASSSSSVEADRSSSELSSLGEIKIKKKLRKRILSISEDSSSSAVSKSSFELQSTGILPLRSEGEVSLGQAPRAGSLKPAKSDGETSFGLFR